MHFWGGGGGGGGGLYHPDYSIVRSTPMYGSCQVSSLLFGLFVSDEQAEASAVEDSKTL